MYMDFIIKRLASLGYIVTEADYWLIGYVTDKVVHSIQADCNITDMPDGLTCIIVDRVCGEFLYAKRNLGQLQLEDVDLSQAIKAIKEGDTEVTYTEGGSDSQRLDVLISSLLDCGKDELTSYRCIKW